MKIAPGPDGHSPRSLTLHLRHRASTGLYLAASVVMLWTALSARLRFAQTPLLDGDWWGYFNPVFSCLTGHGFQHTYGRDSFYPGFLLAIFKLGGEFHAVCVVQHLLGVVTGFLMLGAWCSGCRLLRGDESNIHPMLALVGFVPAAVYLTTPIAIKFEQSIRPEAIFPLFAVLSIWLNLAFMRSVWVISAYNKAAWFGAAQLVMSLIAYKLKPGFGFGFGFANLPMALALCRRGMPRIQKVWMIAGGGLVCALALVLPESILKKRDVTGSLFLPDTLMTVHADQIRDQLAEDVAGRRTTPFPHEQVERLLMSLNARLPLASLPENHPYASLGFSPDYLLYLDNVYGGVTGASPSEYTRRSELGYYFYAETFLHHPGRMLGKIWRQLRIFYHFGTANHSPLFGRRFGLRATKLLLGGKGYESNLKKRADLEAAGDYPLFQPFRPLFTESAELISSTTTIEQSSTLTLLRKLLEIVYLPTLVLTLFISGAVLWKRPWQPERLLPVGMTWLLFSYNFGNNLTVAVVHSLELHRYIESQLAYTLLAPAFGLLLIGDTLRRGFSRLTAGRARGSDDV